MKRRIACVLFIFLHLTFYGQHLISNTNSPKRGDLTINTGIGLSTMYYLVYSFGSASGNPVYSTGYSPVYNVICDYNIDGHSNFGIAFAYQKNTDIPVNSDPYVIFYGYTEYITRLNIAIRYYYDFIKNQNLDVYTGLRLGLSHWTDTITPLQNWTGNGPQITKGAERFTSVPYWASGQIFIGIKWFLIKNFGLNAEFGIGTPYFAEGGICFRINTRKRE